VLALSLVFASAAYGLEQAVDGPEFNDGAPNPTARTDDARNEQRSVQNGSGDVENTNQTTGSGRSSHDRDCVDFATQDEAQEFFDRHGGSSSNDVDNLDADGDGIACEGRAPGDAPVGGIDTGAGGTAAAPGGGSPLPVALGGAGIGLLVVLLASSLRRRPTS
jgi:hypothetical protein